MPLPKHIHYTVERGHDPAKSQNVRDIAMIP